MIFIFDAGIFFAAIALLIVGLLGMVEKVMPTISVVLWIVFAFSVVTCSFMALSKEESLGKRITNFIVNAVVHTYIGLLLAGFLESLNSSNGFDFIGNLLVGGLVMFFGVGLLLYTVGTLIDFDDESSWPYWLRLTLSVAFLTWVGFRFIFK